MVSICCILVKLDVKLNVEGGGGGGGVVCICVLCPIYVYV